MHTIFHRFVHVRLRAIVLRENDLVGYVLALKFRVIDRLLLHIDDEVSVDLLLHVKIISERLLLLKKATNELNLELVNIGSKYHVEPFIVPIGKSR